MMTRLGCRCSCSSLACVLCNSSKSCRRTAVTCVGTCQAGRCSKLVHLLQDSLQPTEMVHELHNPSKGRKQHGPSPSMVKVPKLDLPLPPASPRRRGSTGVDDEMYNFMPLTPAAATLAPRNSSAPMMHAPNSPTPPDSGPVRSAVSRKVAHMQPLQIPAGAATSIDEAVPGPSESEQSSAAVQLPSQPASATGNNAAMDAVGILRQTKNLDQHETLTDTFPPSIGKPHKVDQHPGGSKPGTPRHFAASSSAAAPELSQAYPRSWNGTPRGSGAQQADSADSATQQANTPAETSSGCPGDLVDGQHTLQQLLARNEVCAMTSHGIIGTLAYLMECQTVRRLARSRTNRCCFGDSIDGIGR